MHAKPVLNLGRPAALGHSIVQNKFTSLCRQSGASSPAIAIRARGITEGCSFPGKGWKGAAQLISVALLMVQR